MNTNSNSTKKLFQYAKAGNLDGIKELVEAEAGVNIDIQDENGRTALMLATHEQHFEIANLLIEKGANLDIQDKSGNTALLSTTGDVEIVKALVKKGANMDIQDVDGTTILMAASAHGEIEMVTVLVENGANLDIQDNDGVTALITAIKNQHVELVKYLVENGANLDIQDNDGVTALIDASYSGYIEIVKFLVENEANLDIQDNDGVTALIYASYSGYIEIVKFLVINEADLYIQDNVGDTALITAIKNQHVEIVKYLVENQADLDIQDNDGVTALMLATHEQHFEIANLLIEKGANLDIQDINGDTALILAARNDDIEIVKLLVEKGATMDIQDKYNKTALDYAKNDTIRKLISESSGSLEKWKGFTKLDIDKFDIILDEKSNEYSICPICLNFSDREDGCLYMSHNCKNSGNYYHEKLYNKYKNDKGIIYWCTSCSRICLGHRHYELANYNGNKPELLTGLGNPFQKDCRKSNGGGGLPEKIARFRRFREYALELQDVIDKKSKVSALNELVEEIWNAPLARTKKIKEIAESKRWNISSNEFPKNTVSEPNVTNASNVTNIPFNGKLPTEVEKGRNNVMMNDDIPILRFYHKQQDGSEKIHGIAKENLETFIKRQNKNFGVESFGFCFMYRRCDSRLHPEELKAHISNDLYEEYKKKFNKKFKGQQGGNDENLFVEATDAVCAIVKRNNRGGSRKKRNTRRKGRTQRKRKY